MSDTHKLQYGNNYNWKILELVLDLNLFLTQTLT